MSGRSLPVTVWKTKLYSSDQHHDCTVNTLSYSIFFIYFLLKNKTVVAFKVGKFFWHTLYSSSRSRSNSLLVQF